MREVIENQIKELESIMKLVDPREVYKGIRGMGGNILNTVSEIVDCSFPSDPKELLDFLYDGNHKQRAYEVARNDEHLLTDDFFLVAYHRITVDDIMENINIFSQWWFYTLILDECDDLIPFIDEDMTMRIHKLMSTKSEWCHTFDDIFRILLVEGLGLTYIAHQDENMTVTLSLC